MEHLAASAASTFAPNTMPGSPFEKSRNGGEKAARAAKNVGRIVLDGTLGKEGLKVVKTKENGERRVRVLRSAVWIGKALIDPYGTAEKAVNSALGGVARE